MTRKFLWRVILLLLITNVLTAGIWLLNRNDGEANTVEDFSVEVDQKEPVATIGGEEITYNHWVSTLEEEYGREALEKMVNEEVITQLAKEQEVTINDEVIDLELSLLFTMEGVLTEEEIAVKQREWTKGIKNRIYLEELSTQDIAVSEQEIQTYFNEYKGQYEFSHSIQVSHILLNNETAANKVIDELESGASFAALAREYTLDDATKRDGGYLGYYTETSSFLHSDYFQQAIGMEEHTYSDPFRIGNNGRIAIIYLHRELPDINLSYNTLYNHIRREIALTKMEKTPEPSDLWNQLEVDWIY
ncbi:foldase protein PrsA 4 [Paraliobacillus quinghaiensis]|uniref:peptidylprolyl isomerase n=1 Tax=Paraliobacillus quinghaiensis TaxID=470815 RepID=A0A917WWU7_9BACI|nr:peptidylprolyl isomerase [Paraliobacillus quinghaiensis]GGM36402.1 foldase protein PrsA 4 [Paraliobacillus quinghaiensis]